ncbi:MAG TPA: SURF1 family protein [Dongiaceae bacterium]|jgi:surfeit locus 1 family protein|nr:SURF1 family protein [Dongiaceae bacterium]
MRLPFRPTFWPTVITVPMILIMIGLSVWQVQRLHWKEGLIAERVARTTAAPVALPPAGSDLTALEFHRVLLSGSYDNAHEFYLAARSQNGNVGYWIVTPFKTKAGEIVLVNRGWVPVEKKLPDARKEGQVEGDTQLDGVIRLPQVQVFFQPDNEPQKNVWFYLAPTEMVAASGIPARTDLYLDAGPEPNPGGFPIGGQTRIDLPNDHLQYAITWALLAIALAVIYVVYHLKLERERSKR